MAVTSIFRATARALSYRSSSDDIDLTRAFRAHVSQENWPDPERTVALEPISRKSAVRKMAAAMSALVDGTTQPRFDVFARMLGRLDNPSAIRRARRDSADTSRPATTPRASRRFAGIPGPVGPRSAMVEQSCA
jgi:hypothetical protein